MSSAGPGPSHPGLLPDTSRADLEIAWLDREAEAEQLAANDHRAIAASLRCYALEVRIKALICQKLNLEYLPRACKTHDLNELVIFTGLLAELYDPINFAVAVNWNVLAEFSSKLLNVLRYRPEHLYSVNQADRLDAALDDPHDGVLTWLSRPR